MKRDGQPQILRQNVIDHDSGNIRQAHVASGIPVGEPCVIESHLMENRRVKVVRMNRLFDGFETKFVSGAVRDSKLCVSSSAISFGPTSPVERGRDPREGAGA